MKLGELARSGRGLGDEAFRERFPDPALVFTAGSLSDSAAYDTNKLRDDDDATKTHQKLTGEGRSPSREPVSEAPFDATATDALAAVPPQAASESLRGSAPHSPAKATAVRPVATLAKTEVTADTRVTFVKKGEKNPFLRMITVGRASNNDIKLSEGSVSKAHACFTRSPTGWQLTDQGSANGTFVDGVRLSKGGVANVGDGTPLAFGLAVQATFYTPRGLQALLSRLRLSD